MPKGKDEAKVQGAPRDERRHDERRQGELRPLAQSVAGVVRPLLKERPTAEAGLLLDWPAIVGEELAALARPLKVRFDHPAERRQGVLELACDGPAALELQHRAPQLIERVNAYLGYPAIARLRFRQGRRPARTAPPEQPARLAAKPLPLPPTGHEPLDRALGFLAASLAARDKKTRRR